MVNVLISDEFNTLVQPEIFERAALAALRHQGVDSGQDLSIAVEGDAHLQELNKTFLENDAPTDVLSFPSGGDEVDPETGVVYLGDIIISYPRALEQATSAGHPVIDELSLLVVHGVLHLLGHDHAETDEKAVMWAAQTEILQSLGVHLK
jgi:probable rRNA maturation factor